MFYVNIRPHTNGYHGNPHTTMLDGMISIPKHLQPVYLSARGFVNLTIDNGVVTDVTPNEEALEAYRANHPDKPRPKTDKEKIEELVAQNELYEELIVELAGVVYA